MSLPAFLQGQIDGNVVRAKFTLPQRQKISSPPKAAATASKRDGPKTDNVSADVGKDGPKRQREGLFRIVTCYGTGRFCSVFVLEI